MEIKITNFFNDAEPSDFAASRMELGDDAGRITWANACAHTPPLLSDEEELEAMRCWAKASGGWDAEEIAAWTDTEVNALFVQLVSSVMREGGLSPGMEPEEWDEYYDRANKGQVDGSIFYAADNQEIYFSLEC